MKTKILIYLRKISLRFKLWVTLVLSFGSIGLGSSLAFAPDFLIESRSLSVAIEWADGNVWGSAFILLGLIQAVAAFVAFRSVVWSAATLAGLYSSLCIAIILVSNTDLPAPPSIWVYASMALLSGLLAQATLVHDDETE